MLISILLFSSVLCAKYIDAYLQKVPVGEAVIRVRVRVRFIQFKVPVLAPLCFVIICFVMEPFSYILHSSRVKIDGECHCNIP